MIQSEEEYQFVAILVAERNAWLGGFRTSPGPIGDPNNDQFVWIDGSLIDFNHWEHDQPDNYNSTEFCMMMWGSGTWNDQKCDNQYDPALHINVTIDTFVCQCTDSVI